MKAAAKTQTSQPARTRAFQAVNTELIGLYWRVGEYISRQLATDAWASRALISEYQTRRLIGNYFSANSVNFINWPCPK